MSDACPLCREPLKSEIVSDDGLFVIKCGDCGFFGIDRHTFIEGQDKPIHAGEHLLRAFVREMTDLRADRTDIIGQDGIEAILAKCPRDIEAKAHRLLSHLVKWTKHFGQMLSIPAQRAVAMSYSVNYEETWALCRYLEELGYIEGLMNTDGGPYLRVKAAGFRAVENRSLIPATVVFISSTCHDLLDLRNELATFLEANGCTVKLSEDPHRFAVDPTADSIESCINNVETSDIVVCILDRRYGGVIDAGRWKDMSATEAEIRHAWSLDPPKAVFYFMRDRAWLDYSALRHNDSTNVEWVEQGNSVKRKHWLEFVNLIARLPSHAGKSNWVTQFRSSVDLRPLVLKRVHDFVLSR